MQVIAAKAEDLGAAAVVMARHSRGRLAQFWLGSVTAGCIKSCTVPVVVVPHPPPERRQAVL